MRQDIPIYKGKVRDVYDLGDQLILHSTDRISAFDCVFQELVPKKGVILNQISNLWFRFFSDIPNHILETDYRRFPEGFRDVELEDRAVLVKKCKRIDFECVVRGYISGSAYKEYKQSGTIAGVSYPSGLLDASKLREPIFTPAVKNDSGHDENISEKEMESRVGTELFRILKDRSISIFQRASQALEKEGIILCDTKFEFGIWNGEVILIDEILTPDSSRFWEKSSYKLGSTPPSMDKQILRNYLETILWDKKPPPPPLPSSIIVQIQQKYKEIQEKIQRCL
jgi:phosphoribosylaminoimidazole-succinocarboxamide synthase